jgi:dipeptidyl aminopeptidase/acylaminoacyl peptidase
MFRRVRIVSVETGEITARVDNPGKLGAVAWSPDSRHLALLSASNLHDPTAARLTVVPVAGGVPQDLLPGFAGDVESFAWKGPETLVFVSHQGVGSSLETIAADGGGRRVLLAPEGRVASSVSVARNTGATAFLADSPTHPEELFRLEEGTARRLTDSNPWLAGKELGRQEVVRYTARDGLELEGLLIHPLTREQGQRVPLILVVHGGPEAHHSNGWLTTYSNPGQMAAARGFAVFYPNYRGSTGRGVEFAMSSQGDPAGAEFDDLIDGVDHLIEIGLVDGAKVGITGGSYGGYATAWGSTYYSERFAAGVMFVGISEKLAKWGASDIPQELNLVHDRHWPWEDWDLMLERSPVYYVEKAKTPLLILHGKNDPRVHPSQSLVLYRYLEVYGQTPVRLVWYPDEGHGNRKAAHRLDYSLRMLRWFEHYLQGPGGDKPPVAVEYERPESGKTAEEG